MPCVVNWPVPKSFTRTADVLQCHQTNLQLALIIVTSISGGHVNWSGYARLGRLGAFSIKAFYIVKINGLQRVITEWEISDWIGKLCIVHIHCKNVAMSFIHTYI